MRKIQVVVCEVGKRPVVQEIDDDLDGMQAVVGGLIQRVPLRLNSPGAPFDVWCNEHGIDLDLPLNRVLEGHEVLGTMLVMRQGKGDGSSGSFTDKEARAIVTVFAGPRPRHNHAQALRALMPSWRIK